jgi:hypothetical protein
VNKIGSLLLIFLLVAGRVLIAQNPYIQQYTTQNGLPSNTVYYIFQDSKKFIWFATDAGVSRYDGTSFTNFRKKDGLSSHEIIRIKEDSFGRVWFFHLNTSIDFFFQNKIYNSGNTPFIKTFHNKYYLLGFDQDQDQWMYFFNRGDEVIILEPGNKVTRIALVKENLKKVLKKHPNGLGGQFYMTKGVKRTLVFWQEGGIISYDYGTNEYSCVSDTLKLKGVFPVGNDMIYAVTRQNNILLFDRGKLVKTMLLPDSLTNTLENFTGVREDKDGGLWIVTFNKGAWYMSANREIKHFNIKEGQAMIRDHENNIWISSMQEGVFKISPLLVSHKHFEVSTFQNLGILALGRSATQGIWMTNGKAVFHFLNNKPYELTYKNDLYAFNWVHQFNNNSLLVGVKSFRFLLFKGIRTDNKNQKTLYKTFTTSKFQFKKFSMDQSGKEACSNDGTVVMTLNPDQLLSDIQTIDVGERVYNTFYNSQNELVINTRKNYLYRNKTLIPYPEISQFDNKIISDHLVLNDSTELFNIDGDSLFLFCRNTIYNLSGTVKDLHNLQIRNIAYHEPVLYLSTFRNVYRCDDPSGVIHKKKVQLWLIDVNFRNIHDLMVFNDSLYVASDDGLTIIPGNQIKPAKTTIPVPYIKSISVNDQDKDPSTPGISVRSNTKIAFSFGCVNYSSIPVLFAYKLEGMDTAWTTGTSGNVVYQRLLSGDYVFKLKVRKSTSGWSEEIGYPLQVKASFWRHPLFFTFLVIVALLGITMIIIRRKNVQMKHRELDHHLVTLELKALQSMMNPHFIFNALGSIQNFLLQNKTGEAGLYLSQFARLIRQNMNALNEAMINLDEEFDRLSNYLDLERLRLENKFRYKIEIDEGFDPEDIMIPSMIIQPFVENSIWHGISTLENNGFVSILFSLKDEKSLTVIIEDNGIGIKQAQSYQSKSEKHLNLGMEMIRKRLELLGRKYGVKTRIEFSEAFPGNANPGTRVTLVIPFAYAGSTLQEENS